MNGSKVKGKKCIVEMKDRAFNDSTYLTESKKLHKLGWKASDNFDELFSDTVKWHSDNMDWWPKKVIQAYLSPHPFASGPKNSEIAKLSLQIERKAVPRFESEFFSVC
jgi:hypothetical protein